jgi:hypothetical protein
MRCTRDDVHYTVIVRLALVIQHANHHTHGVHAYKYHAHTNAIVDLRYRIRLYILVRCERVCIVVCEHAVWAQGLHKALELL